jgi:dolichyl-phosphate-mannose--protein O-mannosyl transferase
LQGDGESIPEAVPDEFQSSTEEDLKKPLEAAPKSLQQEVPLPSLEVTCHFHILPLVLFAVAIGTRFYALDQPNHIVFDELHYGRYAGLYQRGIFFFDSHPPLGKQLLALAGYLAGFQGTTTLSVCKRFTSSSCQNQPFDPTAYL